MVGIASLQRCVHELGWLLSHGTGLEIHVLYLDDYLKHYHN